MKNGKLMILLKSLSDKDRMRFRKFLISPVFNENPEMIKLFNLLDQEIITREGRDSLSKELIWRQLFHVAPYNDDRLRRVFSELNKLTMQFLAFKEYQKDPSSEATYLLPAINKNNLKKHFTGAIRQIKNQFEKDGYQNENFHYAAFQLENQRHVYLERTAVKKRRFEHLVKADFHLDCYYVIHKLKHYIEFLMWRRARSFDLEVHLFPGFLEYLKSSELINEPGVAVYYNVVLLYLHPDEGEYYYTLLNLLDENSSFFTSVELQNLYLTAQNYCASRINKGNLEYYRELFNIYKALINKSLILSENIIAPGNYKNIITVGLKIDESKWVESFIQEYSQYLPKANQDNDLNYNLAKVYFHEKEYNKVISQLREVEYKDPVYALGGKLMLLKTYYELKEVNALDSLIDSFRIYLHRNKLISRDVRQQYMNVLRFVRKLPLEKTYDKESVQKLKGQIEGCKALAAKQWLLEKVGEF